MVYKEGQPVLCVCSVVVERNKVEFKLLQPQWQNNKNHPVCSSLFLLVLFFLHIALQSLI